MCLNRRVFIVLIHSIQKNQKIFYNSPKIIKRKASSNKVFYLKTISKNPWGKEATKFRLDFAYKLTAMSDMHLKNCKNKFKNLLSKQNFVRNFEYIQVF